MKLLLCKSVSDHISTCVDVPNCTFTWMLSDIFYNEAFLYD